MTMPIQAKILSNILPLGKAWLGLFFLLALSAFALPSTSMGKVPGKEAAFTSSTIPDSIWALMQGKSVPKNCTVSRAELRYLKVLHYGKNGKVHQGELICNKAIAQDLIDIFRELYKARYKIERISLIDNYGADDTRSMEANNTSCFNFRFMTGSTTRISKHGMGLAIDINPLYNPYVKGDKIDPPSGKKYAKNRDTRKDIPMKIDRSDLCYKLFIKHGFKWGGAWKSAKDYQHFEK